jgi:hypothetical protein
MSRASALNRLRMGWIGVGKMGLPICERRMTRRLAVTTLRRNPEARGCSDHCAMPLVAEVRRQYEVGFVNGCRDLDFFVLAREAARVAGL